MKRLLFVLMALVLLTFSCAFAENGEGLFQIEALDEDESIFSYIDDNHIDTVYRPDGQPFVGEANEGDVMAYLDYVELPNAGVVALRLSIGIVTNEELYGTELDLACGDTELTFAADPMITEYDMIWSEDYSVYLAGEAAALMEALIQNEGQLDFVIRGDREISGSIRIAPDFLRAIWETYVELGGLEQDFSKLISVLSNW
ncbi:MAG: hypothetical protein IK127_09145 [Clostridia bacterium]|nr:hypothetical protein [Clostridia bacterium]